MNYQPIYINGEETGQCQRPCSERYAIIKNYLSYERPISVFDLGANFGYFSFRLAEDFDATCVLVDTKPVEKILRKNNKKTIWLNKRITPEELQKLSLCESFDVVLALSVLHHFDNWKLAVDSLRALGKILIIEPPGLEDIKAVGVDKHKDIYNYVMSFPHDHIADVVTHLGSTRPIIAIQGSDQIYHQTIDAVERNTPLVNVHIDSGYKHKKINITHKNSLESRDFIHGMNLWNFKLLNGAYPTDFNFQKALEKIPFHDDLRPWNFIIDGKELYPIDYSNKTWRTKPEKGGLDKCRRLMTMKPDYKNPEFTSLLTTR